jgi:excisionase family DNA binding protein
MMAALGLSVTDTARELGVSVGTVRRWADSGDLPSFRTPGGQRRFDREEVAAFLRALRPAAVAATAHLSQAAAQ